MNQQNPSLPNGQQPGNMGLQEDLANASWRNEISPSERHAYIAQL